jgi:hypothetical protein
MYRWAWEACRKSYRMYMMCSIMRMILRSRVIL